MSEMRYMHGWNGCVDLDECIKGGGGEELMKFMNTALYIKYEV